MGSRRCTICNLEAKIEKSFFFKVVESYFLIIFLKEFEFFLCSTDFFLVYLVSEIFLRVGHFAFHFAVRENAKCPENY